MFHLLVSYDKSVSFCICAVFFTWAVITVELVTCNTVPEIFGLKLAEGGYQRNAQIRFVCAGRQYFSVV